MSHLHGSAMLLILTFGSLVPAQDLEPTLDRAAGNVVAGLARHLLSRTPVPEALRLLPAGGPAAAASAAVRAALMAEGYRLVDGAEGGVIEIQSWSDPARPYPVLVLEVVGAESARFVSRYADAAWVDERQQDRLVVESGASRTSAEALESARRRAEGMLLHRVGFDGVAAVGASNTRGRVRVERTFVGESSVDDGRVFRAWVEVPSPGRQAALLARALDKEVRRRAVDPWIRGAATLALAACVGLGYLGMDLRTRGYMTGRLRALFGILFLVGAGLCWRLPW